MLYIQYYIKIVHFWLKYNGFATVRKTTKLIEGGHRGFQGYRHNSTFFYVFCVFLKIQKVVTFYVFLPCFVRFLELCCTLTALARGRHLSTVDTVVHFRSWLCRPIGLQLTSSYKNIFAISAVSVHAVHGLNYLANRAYATVLRPSVVCP